MGNCCAGTTVTVAEETQVKPVKTYTGFQEHACRLLFRYEEHFPNEVPDLLTILPSGVIETTKKLSAESERGLIAYSFPQFVEASVAQQVVGKYESSWDGNTYSTTPFVQKSGDKYSLVQTWPTKFNDKFKQDFNCKPNNPDSKKFQPEAVDAFKACMETLFGAGATAKSRIQFCHKVTENNSPCYVGLTEDLMTYLNENKQEMMAIGIKEMTPDGFVANGEDGKGNKVEKPFTMERKTQYVVYKKFGWETMGCCKTLAQFQQEAEFLEESN